MNPPNGARHDESNPPRHTATVDGILGAYAATSTLPYRHTAHSSDGSDPFAEESVTPARQQTQRALLSSLPPLSATNSPSLSTPFLDSPRPSESSWSPTASPYASPSSRPAPRSRNDDSARYARSDDSDHYAGDAPFVETPFRMAMGRQGGSISGHSDYASETAMDIRGDRAEWVSLFSAFSRALLGLVLTWRVRCSSPLLITSTLRQTCPTTTLREYSTLRPTPPPSPPTSTLEPTRPVATISAPSRPKFSPSSKNLAIQRKPTTRCTNQDRRDRELDPIARSWRPTTSRDPPFSRREER